MIVNRESKLYSTPGIFRTEYNVQSMRSELCNGNQHSTQNNPYIQRFGGTSYQLIVVFEEYFGRIILHIFLI